MRVLVIGAGGLGSPVALALTGGAPEAMRLSGLTLIDADVVELSNLHRQLLHGERDLGRRKVDSAADQERSHASRSASLSSAPGSGPDWPALPIRTKTIAAGSAPMEPPVRAELGRTT